MKKALTLGVFASFFFAFTFVLNRQMSLSGGSWLYTASLRFIFMVPLLYIILGLKKQVKPVFKAIKADPKPWFVWSTVGFGIFYAAISFASAYGPSWIVAGTWQITIIAGGLMAPLFYTYVKTDNTIQKVRNKIPIKALLMSTIILIGVTLMQYEQAQKLAPLEVALGIVPVIIAAFAYPLGNRKMIEQNDGRLTTIQRIFGMTICSLPFFLILFIFGFIKTGLPSSNQLIQSFLVAVFTGIIATTLFFRAMDLVSGDMTKMSIIESTQSGTVVFTAIGGIIVLNDQLPGTYGIIGICLVVIGIIANRLVTLKGSK